jgi:hypothetical protein
MDWTTRQVNVGRNLLLKEKSSLFEPGLTSAVKPAPSNLRRFQLAERALCEGT